MAMANTQELPDMMSKLVIDCQASDIDEEMTVGNMTPKSRDVREPQPIYAKLRALEQYKPVGRRTKILDAGIADELQRCGQRETGMSSSSDYGVDSEDPECLLGKSDDEDVNEYQDLVYFDKNTWGLPRTAHF